MKIKITNHIIKSILFAGIAQLALTGCIDLDEEPKSFISSDQFFQTQADADGRSE
jgi:hypothetical protein